jgi:uncharacterized Zn-binding protein involved in type VI secretion
MPGPAARVGDMTAHGGVIAGPGCPTVLIGGQPAANVTTMHTCPLVTVLVPHVGGPILPPGVPTVLIGGMPAATVGDMATCVGPPDVIIPPGCPTVLIGTSGGGSGGGGGGSAAAANAGAHSALVGEPGPEAEGPHWIDIQFVDSAGNPVTEVPYELTDVDGHKVQGRLTGDATIRRGGLPNEGDYTVRLFSVFNAQWSEESARVGDVVKLSAETKGYEDGTPARFQIYERDIEGPDKEVARIKTQVQADKLECEWEYQYIEDSDDYPKEGGFESYSSPEYYFEAAVGDQKARSGLLEFEDCVEIELKDENDNPVANEDYILYLANGEVRRGKVDSNGYKKEENVPPGEWDVEFPNLCNASEKVD